jgi:hypothetical protein
VSDSRHDIGKSTLNAQPVPSIVLIAVNDIAAEMCRAHVPALMLRVYDFREATWRIPIARPRVIAIGKVLTTDESSELEELASAVGATVVHLASCVLPNDVRDRLVNAWRAAEEKAGA